MKYSYFRIKSMVFPLLIGFQVTMMASCQSDSTSDSNMVIAKQAEESSVKIQTNREKDSSCCQSNIPDRFSVPSKTMKPEGLRLGVGDN